MMSKQNTCSQSQGKHINQTFSIYLDESCHSVRVIQMSWRESYEASGTSMIIIPQYTIHQLILNGLPKKKV